MENEYFCLYPIYIDSGRSLSEGRKYKKDLCVPHPRCHEIKNALDKLDIEYIDEVSKRHPRDFFNKGKFQIKKIYGKKLVIEGVIQRISESRSMRRVGNGGEEQRQGHKAVHGIVQNGVYVENKLNLVAKRKKGKKK